jgi:hypothetical protein
MTTSADPLTSAQPPPVVGGVDTHADTHTAAVIDAAGQLLAHRQFFATPANYQQLANV